MPRTAAPSPATTSRTRRSDAPVPVAGQAARKAYIEAATAAGGSDHFIVLDIRDNNDNFGEVNEVYNHFESLWLSH